MAAVYSFRDLDAFLKTLRPVSTRFGVHTVDINEVTNRVELTTPNDESASALTQWAAAHGVPESALGVRSGPMVQSTYTWGGDGITVDWTYPKKVNCSLTQVVEHHWPDATVDTLLFGITNAHCTEAFGANTGSKIENANGSSWVATEVWDHAMITDARCEALMGTTEPLCRYSDGALFGYSSSVTNQLHRHMVRPSLDSLHGEDRAIAGDVVNKYGNTTGLTYGQITHTCVDVDAIVDDPHMSWASYVNMRLTIPLT